MITKCLTEGAAVYAIVFHPRLHLLLASLGSGEIQLWDYVNRILVKAFLHHICRVGALDFHTQHTLFVSGGDDAEIVVWDFRQSEMLCALKGHTKCVRTVQFHFHHPWILSASDDGTCRIWDWKTRSCVNVTRAHKREVMIAKFCPYTYAFVTVSRDKTARVWEVNFITGKRCSAQRSAEESDTNSTDEVVVPTSKIDEIMKKYDVVGFRVYATNTLIHDDIVTWAMFNRVRNRIVTATGEGYIYIWSYERTSIKPIESLRRCDTDACTMFVLTDSMKYILSVSENKSIVVWNTDIRQSYLIRKLKDDVYYTLQKAPNFNYLATGHSSGLSAFKIFKDRPIATVVGETLFYVSNYIIYSSNIDKEIDMAEQWTMKKPKDEKNNNGAGSYNSLSGEGIPTDKYRDFRIIEFFRLQYRYNGCKVIIDKVNAPDYLIFSPPLHEFSRLHRTKVLACDGMREYKMVFNKFRKAAMLMPEAAPLPTRRDPVIPSKVQYNSYCSYGKLLLVTCTIRTWPFYEILLYGNGSVYNIECGTICYLGDGTSACFASAFLVVAIDFDKNVVLHTVFGDRLKHLKFDTTFHKVFSICVNIVLLWGRNDTVLLYDVERDQILCQTYACMGELSEVIVDESGKFIAAVFRNLVVIYDMGLNVLASVETQAKVKTAVWYNDITVIYATRDRMYYLMLNGDSGTVRSLDEPIYVLRVKENVLYYMKRDHLCYKMEIESADLALKLAMYRGDMDTVEELIASGKVSGHAMVEYLIEKGYSVLARKMSSDPQERFWLALKMGDIEGAMGDAVIINDSETWKRLGNVALEQGNCAVAELAFQKGKCLKKLAMLYLIMGCFAKLKRLMNLCKVRNDIPPLMQCALYLGDMAEIANALRANKQTKLAEICENTYGVINEVGMTNQSGSVHYMTPPQPIRRSSGEMMVWPVKPRKPIAEDSLCHEADPSNKSANAVSSEDINASDSPALSYEGGHTTVESSSSLCSESTASGHMPHKFSDTSNGRCQSYEERLSIGSSKFIADNFKETWKHDTELPSESTSSHHSISQCESDSSNPDCTQLGVNSVNHNLADAVESVPKDYVDCIMTMASYQLYVAEHGKAAENFRLLLRYWLSYKNEDSGQRIQKFQAYLIAILIDAESHRYNKTDPRRSLELTAYLTCCDMLPWHVYATRKNAMTRMRQATNYRTAARLAETLMTMDSQLIGEDEDVALERCRRIRKECLQHDYDTYPLDFDRDDERDLRICTISLVKLKGQPTVRCRLCGAVALEKFQFHQCNICQLCELTKDGALRHDPGYDDYLRVVVAERLEFHLLAEVLLFWKVIPISAMVMRFLRLSATMMSECGK
ncbi:coatomer complex subunit alpha [Babesia caballi]|uniref:Coatomer complex subunit alpha n=1 Tax=Babesia caballi TaxID=5871 RepID=A0AAV4LUZ6_BABCB|nr:coatomer complex subunit alpha [Babesia caballi]